MPTSDSSPPLRLEGLTKEEQRSLSSLSHLRTASPTGRPGQNITSDSDPLLRPGMRRTPAYSSSPTGAIKSRLGPTDRGRPLGKDQETDEESKAGDSNQPQHTCMTVPCDLPGMTEPKQCCRRRHFSLQCCGRRQLSYRTNTVRLPTCL